MSTVKGFLFKSRKSRYHRIHIPKRLRPYFGGRVEVWRSLGTPDEERAEVRVAEWGSRSKQLFLTLKRQGHLMTSEQIETLVAFWLERELDEAEDARAISGPVSDDYREDMHLGLMHMSDDAHEALVACDYRKIEHEVDELLRVAGFPALDHQGAQFGRLCRKFLVAKQKYTRIEADRWDGVYQEGYVNGVVSNSGPVNPTKTITAVKGKPFSEVVKLYFNENTRATRTDAQVKAELERFIEVLGTGGGEGFYPDFTDG